MKNKIIIGTLIVLLIGSLGLANHYRRSSLSANTELYWFNQANQTAISMILNPDNVCGIDSEDDNGYCLSNNDTKIIINLLK